MSNTSPTAAPAPVRGIAVTRDNTNLAYALHAQGDGRPRLVLIHSLAMSGDFWAPVVQRIAAKVDVLTYDCRGHGASDKPAGPYGVDLFANDLADLLDHVGWQSATVAGASMGGSIALAFAAAHGARTNALGLIDTTAWYGAEAPKNWAERADKAREQGLQSLVGFQQTRWFGDDFREKNPQVVESCVSTFLRNDVTAFRSTCEMLGAFDLRAALPRLSMPTAVVVGEEDFATPVSMAQAMHAGITDSTFQVISGARHLTPLECPDLIADVLLQLTARSTQ